MELNIAIDIETTDTSPTAGVWEIGAVAWKKGTDPAASDIRTRAQMNPVGALGLDTLNWIKSQGPEINQAFDRAIKYAPATRLVIPEFFHNLQEFIYIDYEAAADTDEWANLISCNWYSWGQFDFPILHHQLYMIGYPVPWHYRRINDFRSVINAQLPGSSFYGARPKTSHRALDDAQALADLVAEYQLVENSSSSPE